MNQELKTEQEHFRGTQKRIKENVSHYEKKYRALKAESEELFKAVKGGDTELYNQLMASQSITVHAQTNLEKNKAALRKPYFGRVDFVDEDIHTKESLYIGKNGVSQGQEIIVVDWRAPVSTVYYENEMGAGTYQVPSGAFIPVELELKRTYDVEEGKLLGFYDNDAASNDELLVKYLAQNKEAVLGDIIATIQREQNEIIRDSPFHNVIVQGVAGSGKTTVAMHRISYVLFNYPDRFQSNAFCIIGSNDLLLDYITSGLPELDVRDVKHMRMDVFFHHLLGKDWKKSYRIVDNRPEDGWKSKKVFVLALEEFLEEYRRQALPAADVTDRELGVILSASNIQETLGLSRGISVHQTASLLNERVRNRLDFLVADGEKEFLKAKRAGYRGYFDPLKGRKTGLSLYLEFLETLAYPSCKEAMEQAAKGRLDVYDLAALVLIKFRISARESSDEFSQIIVDEAQDFGEMVYYVQKQVLQDCYFTIMGDVSQNINYETGMNDWEDLKSLLFEKERDRFCMLSKSYRNTIEISGLAGRVLEKISAGAYRIDPVLRHGMEVQIYREEENAAISLVKRLIREIEGRGYDTVAVVCRNEADAGEVERLLSIPRNHSGDGNGFHKGVMVLPIRLTKGLEFDAVILWKPDQERYGMSEKEGKLLYVALTRALHELHLVVTGQLSPLLQ